MRKFLVVGLAAFLASAVPAGAGTETREFRLPAGAELTVRVHYKKTWQFEGKPLEDASTVGLYFAPATTAQELLVVPLAAPAAGAQSGAPDSYLLVIVGLSGDAENATRFHQWASTLVDTARDRGGLAPEHVSVYMLEIDEDSRLGREILLGGHRYGACLSSTISASSNGKYKMEA